VFVNMKIKVKMKMQMKSDGGGAWCNLIVGTLSSSPSRKRRRFAARACRACGPVGTIGPDSGDVAIGVKARACFRQTTRTSDSTLVAHGRRRVGRSPTAKRLCSNRDNGDCAPAAMKPDPTHADIDVNDM